MRVVALLVILCGCRVDTATPPVDAAPVQGDGLVERVIVDSGAPWADLSDEEGTSGGQDSGRARDGMGDVVDDGAAADGSSAQPCQLLVGSCPSRQGCYPFPFESAGPTGETQCAFQGAGAATVPCQSQLECDGTSLCSSPGEPDSVCRLRCDPAAPVCPAGNACVAFAGYRSVGTCQ